MEFKGTKGKWVARFKPENPLLIENTLGNPIANTFYDDGELIALSNAQLIAHAPEMLEIMKELTELKSSSFLLDELQERAKQLLKEATEIN